MSDYPENKSFKGVITNKIKSTSENPKAPAGNFYAPEPSEYTNSAIKQFTCWKKELFDAFDIGDSVIIVYQESEWNGNTNRNISAMTHEGPKKTQHTTIDNEAITEKIVDTPVEKPVVKNLNDEVMEEPVIETMIDESQFFPELENYFIVMKGKKYKMVPTGDYLVDGVWKSIRSQQLDVKKNISPSLSGKEGINDGLSPDLKR